MEENDATPYVSIIAATIIQIILITLKLTNVLTCTWWLILLPLEIEAGATIITFNIVAIILIVEMYKDYRNKKKRR